MGSSAQDLIVHMDSLELLYDAAGDLAAPYDFVWIATENNCMSTSAF